MGVSTETAVTAASANLLQEPRIHMRRNFGLGVISGIAYNLYIAVLSTELVMTWFLSELTDSNVLISLLVPIELGSWFFLQLLLSGYVQRRPRTIALYRSMAVIRLVAAAILSVATFALEESSVLLIVFLAAFTVNSVAAGVAALPFLNIVAKTIPATRRGMYFGWRRFAGGLLGILGGALVKLVLSPDFPLAFPDNYALLFSLGFFITAALVGSFSLVVEPAETVDTQHASLGEQWRRAMRLPSSDRSYNRYLRMRVAIVASGFALPFYAVYARRSLSAPEDTVGVYLIAATLTGVLFNLVSGQLGDRRGNLLLVRIAALTAVLPAGMALLVPRLPYSGLDVSLTFALVFVAQGLHVAVTSIGNINYVLELARPSDRALYIGFANGIVGITVFASPLGGLIVDWAGFEALFLFSLSCALLAVILSLGLQEPRKAFTTG